MKKIAPQSPVAMPCTDSIVGLPWTDSIVGLRSVYRSVTSKELQESLLQVTVGYTRLECRYPVLGPRLLSGDYG